ncbi:MAG: hypothetical protein DME97_09740 [Verrucomicrobia bacterium]|nr:MAG: hypothetical protein DME97_09740 [Verrucomicrobiota bacterium]
MNVSVGWSDELLFIGVRLISTKTGGRSFQNLCDPHFGSRKQGLRIKSNVSTTLGELDYFCEQMELIACNGLPA